MSLGENKVNDDLFATLIRKLKKDNFRLQRFPLSLQLVAFRAIPQLLSCIPAPTDTYGPGRSSSATTSLHLFQRHLPHGISPDLQVTPIIPIESQSQPSWGVWPNDPKEDCVIYLEQLIDDQHSFNKAMWPGGVTSEPFNVAPKARGKRVGNKDSRRW
ncbi:hypothetical protein F2Q69_00036807 [Brassica cretica]|uniref:Uncharacterized protein n=1 Tax=Brassica cretica TaxID=69181 RepID=A0A8S9SP85_BRACR|nr:hypothetical protein F2Q69_00036807 [Brassica cretica]